MPRFSVNREQVRKFLDPRWHEKKDKNAFVFNIILGVSFILVLSVVLKDTTIRQEAMNLYFDQYMLWRMDAEKNSFFDKYILLGLAADREARKNAREMIFLDFDNSAIKAINRPELTPRDKIADLIRAAYHGGASIIVVDTGFLEADKSPASLLEGDEVALTGEERDQILYDLLKTIRDDSNSDTKVLLPRMTYSDHTEQSNIFADLVDGKKIFEVTPLLTEYKSVARFWVPYIKAYRADTGEPYILWSIPVMTLALKYDRLEELKILEKNILNDEHQKEDHYLKIYRNSVEEKFPVYEEMTVGDDVVRDTRAVRDISRRR